MENNVDNANTRMSFYELSELADRILKEKGFNIFGRPKSEVEYLQTKFEYSMQTGAYSRNQSRRE